MNHPAVREGQKRLREWHRGFPERKIGGVCSGVAHQLDLPLTLVRAAFILMAVFPGSTALGVSLYLILWFLMPAEPGAPSGLDRIVDAVGAFTGGGEEGRGALEDPDTRGESR